MGRYVINVSLRGGPLHNAFVRYRSVVPAGFASAIFGVCQTLESRDFFLFSKKLVTIHSRPTLTMPDVAAKKLIKENEFICNLQAEFPALNRICDI